MNETTGRAVAWAMAFGTLTLPLLATLALVLWMAHGMAYGAAVVFMPDAEPAPPTERHYTAAFLVGAAVELLTACSLAWLARATPSGSWHPALQGVTAAVLAAAVGAASLLMYLGISPVDLLLNV